MPRSMSRQTLGDTLSNTAILGMPSAPTDARSITGQFPLIVLTRTLRKSPSPPLTQRDNSAATTSSKYKRLRASPVAIAMFLLAAEEAKLRRFFIVNTGNGTLQHPL